MDNPEKLATYGTQDEYTYIKNTTQCALDTNEVTKTCALNWRLRQTEYRFHELIVTDTTSQKSERNDR